MNKKDKEIEPTDNEITHRLFQESMRATKYRLFIGEFASLDHELDEIINKLSNATESDILEVNISSPGGYTDDLMKIENVIRENFYGRTKTILNAYGYSCGAMIFLCGDERIIYENSQLMFHNITTGAYGKLSDLVDQVHHNKKFFENYMRYSLKPYFTKKEIDDLMMGKEFWLDALEICERKICTGISVFGATMAPELYIKYRKDKKTRCELLRELEKTNALSKKDADFIATIK